MAVGCELLSHCSQGKNTTAGQVDKMGFQQCGEGYEQRLKINQSAKEDLILCLLCTFFFLNNV